MKLITKVSVVALLALISAASQTSSYAVDPGKASKSDETALGVLAGTAIPTAELGRFHGQGASVAVTAGDVSNNSVGSNSSMGMNTITNSVNNNTGITTVSRTRATILFSKAARAFI